MIRFFAALVFLVVAASCGSERLSWWRVAVNPANLCRGSESRTVVMSTLPTLLDWEFFSSPDGRFVLAGAEPDLEQTFEGLECSPWGKEIACRGSRTTLLHPGTGLETEIAQGLSWEMAAKVDGDLMTGGISKTFSTTCNRGCADFTPVPDCTELRFFSGIKQQERAD